MKKKLLLFLSAVFFCLSCKNKVQNKTGNDFEFTITFPGTVLKAELNGLPFSSGMKAVKGSKIKFTALSPSAFCVEAWTLDGRRTIDFKSEYFLTVRGNHTVSVDFIPISLSMVTVIPNGKSEDIIIQNKPCRLTPYKIARFEVTCGLWKEVYAEAEKAGYKFESSGFITEDIIPVTEISWNDVIVWCNALSERQNKIPVYRNAQNEVIKDATDANVCSLARVLKSANGYRLPVEGEWEFAARGGNPENSAVWNYTYAGGNELNDLGWYFQNSGGKLKAAGLKKANTLGLYDMSGNVWEWCWDWYNEEETARINRGGGAGSPAEFCKVSENGSNFPYVKDKLLGFRLAINIQ